MPKNDTQHETDLKFCFGGVMDTNREHETPPAHIKGEVPRLNDLNDGDEEPNNRKTP